MNTDRIRTWRIPRQNVPVPVPELEQAAAPRVLPPRTRTLREIERHQFDRIERRR